MDEILFNHEIEFDFIRIDSDPVLHIIDRGTRYSLARFVQNESVEHVWEILQKFLVHCIYRIPFIIAHDQDPQFTSDYF